MADTIAPNKYRCAACGRVYEKGWTDEEAAAERDETFPNHEEMEMAVVCDGCYRAIMGVPIVQ